MPALPSFIENISACFNSLRAEDLQFLNQKKTQVAYAKGETLLKQTAFAPHVLFLNSGYAITSLETNVSKHINVYLAQRGDYLGFSALFSDTYKYSAIALTDAQLCMIEKSALKTVLQQNPDFAWQITARNWQHETRYLDMIKTLSFKQMRGKFASALLYLDSFNTAGNNVFPLLTRQQLADFAAITVESTVRLLKEFEKEKLLALQQKNIIIQNRVTLQNISHHG